MLPEIPRDWHESIPGTLAGQPSCELAHGVSLADSEESSGLDVAGLRVV